MASGMSTERNLGLQPIAGVLAELELLPHALVEASTEQITHKMVSRAMKGRRLTRNTRDKIVRALNAASGNHYSAADLFNYES